MSGPCANLPEVPRSDQTVAVLVVSPVEGTVSGLRCIFQHTNWSFFHVSSCREAVAFLKKRALAVVIAEYRLPDGTWKSLLDAVARNPMPPAAAAPLVVVTSADADDGMWSEVLNLGGYDILPMPFDRGEVTRVISLAWLHWMESCRAAQRMPARADAEAPTAMHASA